MRWVVSARYGRCIEGLQRAEAAINFRLSQLQGAALRGEQIDLDNDFDLRLLLDDRKDWISLIRSTPIFVEEGA